MIGFDVNWIRGLGRVIAINDSYQLAPHADVLYSSDFPWWRRSRIQVQHSWFGQYIVLMNDGAWVGEGVRSLRQGPDRGLSHDPKTLCNGKNSGYAAINLAYLFGAARIYLLGYDMRVTNNRIHWHGNDHASPVEYQRRCDKLWLPLFDTLVGPLKTAGVEVRNVNPESALHCWPKIALRDAVIECRRDMFPVLQA